MQELILTNQNLITKCTCGSVEFYIFEDVLHFAQVDDKGSLTSYDCESACARFECAECGAEYDSDNFNGINF
jgi:hypothetical protein